MGVCVDCGGYACTSWGSHDYAVLCDECAHKRRQTKIIEKSGSLKVSSDFAKWDSGDMSELFWIHLGRYVKEPNPESLKYMRMAVLWAGHDNHGISNSFHNALKWAGIDLWTEEQKWREKRGPN